MDATHMRLAAALLLLNFGGQCLADPPAAAAKPRLDLYGEPLPDGAIARMGTTRFHHDAREVAFLDAKTLVTAGDGVRVWDIASGKIIREIKSNQFSTGRPMALSGDGRVLISVGFDSRLTAWDVTTGKMIAERQKNSSERRGDTIVKLAISRDGHRFASLREVERRIWVWSKDKDGKDSQIDLPAEFDASAMAMSPDGKALAVAGVVEANPNTKVELQIRDTNTGRLIRSSDPGLGTVSNLVYSPDGLKLLLLGDTALAAYDPAGKKLWTAKRGEQVLNVRFSADGRTVIMICASTNRQRGTEIQTLDAETGKVLRTWKAPLLWLMSASTSPDSKTLATAGLGSIQFWNLADGREVRKTPGHPRAICTTCITPDGKYVASTDFYDRDVRLWEIASGKEVRSFQGHEAGCIEIVLSPDGKLLASSSYDSTVRVWEVATGRQVAKFSDFPQPVWFLRFTADGGKLAVSPSGASEVVLFDIKTGKKLSSHRSGQGFALSSLLRHPDGRILAVSKNLGFNPNNGTRHVSVSVWDVLGDRLVQQLDGLTNSLACAILSPDGRMLATREYGGAFRLWELATGQERVRIEEGASGSGQTGTQIFAFSPDGTTIASAALQEPKIHLWDVATGKPIASFPAHTKAMYTVEYTPDGKTLVSGSQDSTLMSWDMTLPRRQAMAAFASLTDAARAQHWEKLGGPADEAFRSILALSGDRTNAVKFLSGKFGRVAPIPAEQIKQWISDLDSPQFAARERAEKGLQAHANQAESELRQALAIAGAEGRRRIHRILESAASVTASPETLREIRAVEVLEKIGTPEARDALKSLVSGKFRTRTVREAEAALQRIRK